VTELALRPARLALPVLADLLERQRTLALYGMTLLLLALVAVALQPIDPRTLASGVDVWVKPAKFLASVGMLALTLAWFFGYVRPERRSARLPRAAVFLVLVAGSFELAWITWQGANGLESHFNLDTLFYQRMFNLMGLFAVLLVGATLPLAWEIGRRPAAGLSGDFVAAVVIGLVLAFLLGGSFGGAIAANGGHAVGPEAGAVPVFGWNRGGGDLRIAHFAGIHAMQAIPLMAAMAGMLAARVRWLILFAGTLLYAALAIALYVQAAAARPLLPL
jgi:hypothetical protein